MVYRTEFEIDMQNVTRNEETYMNELYKIISSLVDEQHTVRGKLFEMNYKAKSARNLVSFAWKSLPNVFTENPGGILNTVQSAEDLNEKMHVREMHKALKKVKWLKKHNISNIATAEWS